MQKSHHTLGGRINKQPISINVMNEKTLFDINTGDKIRKPQNKDYTHVLLKVGESQNQSLFQMPLL